MCFRARLGSSLLAYQGKEVSKEGEEAADEGEDDDVAGGDHQAAQAVAKGRGGLQSKTCRVLSREKLRAGDDITVHNGRRPRRSGGSDRLLAGVGTEQRCRCMFT